jgi:glyoxylase-like metal-dependent hydrolase (beta-lactamase superfamily II)
VLRSGCRTTGGPPIELIEGVHLVGSGRLGLSLSDDHDCNIYLVEGGKESVLIDAGCGLGTGLVLDAIESARAPRVSRILLTHAHPDHAAGAAGLAAALGAEVWASAAVGSILASGDEVASGLATALRAGTYPGDVRLAATPIGGILDAGPVQVGDREIDVLTTPGHAAGHLCFRLVTGGATAIFTGDLLFSRGRTAVLATPDTDLRLLASSIRAVAACAPDILFPGHCEPVLRGAARHVETAVAAFDLAALPESLI